MIDLTIYRQDRTVTRQIADTWNELTASQLIAIAHLLNTNVTDTELDMHLVKIIFEFSYKEMQQASPEVIQSLVKYIQWVKESCTLTKQLLPHLKVKSKVYFGPSDNLENIRFLEFDAAERELYRWQKNMDDSKQLFRFVAVLYRLGISGYNHKLNPNGDPRVPYNSNVVDYYAEKLRKSLPESTAIAITMWYKGCRQHIVSQFPEIFDRSGGNSDNIEEAEPQYFDLMRAIAKEHIYGGFEAIENLYFYTALFEILSAIREQEHNKHTEEQQDEEQ